MRMRKGLLFLARRARESGVEVVCQDLAFELVRE